MKGAGGLPELQLYEASGSQEMDGTHALVTHPSKQEPWYVEELLLRDISSEETTVPSGAIGYITTGNKIRIYGEYKKFNEGEHTRIGRLNQTGAAWRSPRKR